MIRHVVVFRWIPEATGKYQGIFGAIWPGGLMRDSADVSLIDECHLPGTICHQDPGRYAEGVNGLVNVGCPAATPLGIRSGAVVQS